MRESSKGTKQLLSVYIDKEIVSKIKTEATRQHRKVSGQCELYLADAINHLKGCTP